MKKIHTHSKSQSSFIFSQLPAFSQSTPKEYFDNRCEYHVPRFFDLTQDLNGECLMEEDNRMEEEFFKWFQVSHDFQISKKQINFTREKAYNLPPKQEQVKKTQVSSKIQKQAIEYKFNQQKSLKQQLREKLNGSQTERNLHQPKQTLSRNVFPKHQSSQILHTLHKMKSSQKSFDATNCNLFQKITALNQQQQTQSSQKVSSKNLDKVEKIIIDLTPNSNANKIKFSSKGEKIILNAGKQTSRNESKMHHSRVGSTSSQRTDFISRNKDIVKLLSARSKERKNSSNQIGFIDDIIDPHNQEILVNPKIKDSSSSVQTFHKSAKSISTSSHQTSKKELKACPLFFKDDIKPTNSFASFLGGSTGGSYQQQKKKNGRVNSQQQFKSISNCTLFKQSTMDYKMIESEMMSTVNSSRKNTKTADQENQIESNTYLKQLLLMQDKYHQQRHRQRNMGIGSSMGGLGKQNFLNTQLSEKFGSGMLGGGTLSNITNKQLPTKQGRNAPKRFEQTTREKKRREPLVSQITLENL